MLRGEQRCQQRRNCPSRSGFERPLQPLQPLQRVLQVLTEGEGLPFGEPRGNGGDGRGGGEVFGQFGAGEPFVVRLIRECHCRAWTVPAGRCRQPDPPVAPGTMIGAFWCAARPCWLIYLWFDAAESKGWIDCCADGAIFLGLRGAGAWAAGRASYRCVRDPWLFGSDFARSLLGLGLEWGWVRGHEQMVRNGREATACL
eukprot:COSAG02_NODE_278_length_25916_cov_19.826432_5_plen_200_part_00